LIFLQYSIISILAILAAALFAPEDARALAPRDVNLTIATDPFLAVDSNFCSTGEGPRAAYLGVTIENTSGGTLTGVTANLTGLTNGFTLGGGQAPEQFVGVLAAGERRTVYWYVQYFIDCTGGGGNFRVTRSSLNLTISDSNPGVVTDTERFVETRSSISASSGGLIVNTTLGPGFFLGQTVPYDVGYESGNVGRRDNFNLQPAGNLTYNAGCFQLVGSEVISSITDAIPVGTRDTLFFQSTAQQTGSGNRATIRYFLRYLCTGVSTTASPYASQTSGNSNLKYTGNYEDPNDTNDNNPNWPDRNIYLKGGFSLVSIQPGDELEYTVYFISSGGETALNVSLCDILPEETIFLNDGFGSDRGIAFFNTITSPLPNPPLATSLTNNSGDDEGEFFIPGSLSIPAFCSGDTANNLSTSGAVVLNINDLPNATAPGNPANSYGFFRFKVTVE